MAFSGAFRAPFAKTFDAGLAAAAVPWYLAGGAPTPIAVYEPKGKADLATSYVNLVNPGTYNAAPGVAPTLDASGWVFNGSSQYLTTSVVPLYTWSMLVRFSDVTNGGILAGRDGSSSFGRFWILPDNGSTVVYGVRLNTLSTSPDLSNGVLAIASLNCYRNGAFDGLITDSSGDGSYPIWIGCRNANNSTINLPIAAKIQAISIWNTSTGHATWMPAVMAACAII